MDFDWAAWHKKFDEFGISTKRNDDQHPKFPGSFPEEDEAIPEVEQQTAEAPQDESKRNPSSSQSNGRQYAAAQNWKREMDEEAEDAVWKDHLDKLQASGKLRERKDGYADPREQEDEVSEPEAEPDFPQFTFEELQVRSMIYVISQSTYRHFLFALRKC